MISPKVFNLILIDPQQDLCDAWIETFQDFSQVEVVHGYFEQVKKFDCLVSPANSFGLMDGGVDLAIRRFFGMQLQYSVQKRIQKEFYGEQPVGTSMIVDTEHEDHPFLAHTPTMRVPMDISNTTQVYDAMFAMLRAVANHNKESPLRIEKVLCPGLGTATGRMLASEAARQMALAFHNFLHPTSNMTWPNLLRRNGQIQGTGT